MKHLFFGGVHPDDKKALSNGSTELGRVTPELVVIPLRQHIGSPTKPLVRVGDYVRVGQKIGDGEGDALCVPVHASVSGEVIAIEPRPNAGGFLADSIVIRNDFKDETVEFVPCDTPTAELDEDYVVDAIREAGIVGMGGAAFPSDKKALSAMKNVDTLIANACECEPYITSDDTLLRTEPEKVLEGMEIMHRILASSRMVIAVEDNKKAAIDRLTKLLSKYPDIELRVLPTRYPQGSEKQLIQAVTGREVPPGGLPTSVSCVVLNVSTFAAIHRAVRLGVPLYERIVTLTGEALRSPQNLLARIGTPFIDLIEAAGGLTDDAYKVISGGPMMGFTQNDLTVPIVKATNSILCLKRDAEPEEWSVCIRCGKCVEVCPMHLQPLNFYRFGRAKQVGKLTEFNILDCMECGSCAYICPGKLPLVREIRAGKKLVKEATK